MVLDSKAMGWASDQKLDTAALKKAKIPIYGKWYFPELPADVPLVNLQTGEVETFGPGLRAGAILYVKEEDLKEAELGPYAATAAPPTSKPSEEAAPAPAREAEPVGDGGAAAAEPAAEPPPGGRSLGTEDPAATAEPVQPSASPTMPAIGEQQPVRMLHDDATHAPAERAVTSHPAHEGAPGGHEARAHAIHDAHAAVAEHAHPQPRTYVAVALILAVITAIEVAVYYIPGLLAFIVPILLVLSLIKFAMVVGYFMHLKFDHKIYTGLFVGGLAIAISVFLGMGLMFLGTPYGGGN
jgi:cytochrome c oxidase subunit 4